MATSRLRGGTPFMRVPAIRMSPADMVSRPASERRRVDLPQPDGPTSATKVPFLMERLMFFSAWKAP
ncbi:hypothetical protein D3C71_622940 [compost metagenome]